MLSQLITHMQGRTLRSLPPMRDPVASLVLCPAHHLLLAAGRRMLLCDVTDLSCAAICQQRPLDFLRVML